jgi:predicted phosphodiesterase
MHQPSKPFRIVQVSDTHISRRRAYFVDNWDVFVSEMQRVRPDLIVHSGDVSFDGVSDEDDIAFAREEKNRLAAPWVAIAGNRDTGGQPLTANLRQPPINAERLARWRRHYGTSYWCRDIGAWRLIGIDSALLGNGDADAHQQTVFMESSLRGRAGRPVMLFQHVPPFDKNPEDAELTNLAVPHAMRRWLLDLCLDNGVSVIACGHLHVYRHLEYHGIEIVWAPATSFANIIEKQRAGLGVPRAGYIEWKLDGRSVSHRLVEPPLMITHDIGRWNTEYGSAAKLPPRPLLRVGGDGV